MTKMALNMNMKTMFGSSNASRMEELEREILIREIVGELGPDVATKRMVMATFKQRKGLDNLSNAEKKRIKFCLDKIIEELMEESLLSRNSSFEAPHTDTNKEVKMEGLNDVTDTSCVKKEKNSDFLERNREVPKPQRQQAFETSVNENFENKSKSPRKSRIEARLQSTTNKGEIPRTLYTKVDNILQPSKLHHREATNGNKASLTGKRQYLVEHDTKSKQPLRQSKKIKDKTKPGSDLDDTAKFNVLKPKKNLSVAAIREAIFDTDSDCDQLSIDQSDSDYDEAHKQLRKRGRSSAFENRRNMLDSDSDFYQSDTASLSSSPAKLQIVMSEDDSSLNSPLAVRRKRKMTFIPSESELEEEDNPVEINFSDTSIEITKKGNSHIEVDENLSFKCYDDEEECDKTIEKEKDRSGCYDEADLSLPEGNDNPDVTLVDEDQHSSFAKSSYHDSRISMTKNMPGCRVVLIDCLSKLCDVRHGLYRGTCSPNSLCSDSGESECKYSARERINVKKTLAAERKRSVSGLDESFCSQKASRRKRKNFASELDESDSEAKQCDLRVGRHSLSQLKGFHEPSSSPKSGVGVSIKDFSFEEDIDFISDHRDDEGKQLDVFQVLEERLEHRMKGSPWKCMKVSTKRKKSLEEKHSVSKKRKVDKSETRSYDCQRDSSSTSLKSNSDVPSSDSASDEEWQRITEIDTDDDLPLSKVKKSVNHVRDTENDGKKKKKKTTEETDPVDTKYCEELTYLRKLCHHVRVIVRDTIELKGCDSVKAKVERIKTVLKEKGMKGKPSMKNAEQFLLDKEVRELGITLINTDDDSRCSRSRSSQTKNRKKTRESNDANGLADRTSIFSNNHMSDIFTCDYSSD